MITVSLVIGALLALLLSAISSGSETGVYCLNRVRLRVRSQQGDPSAEKLARMMERQEDLVITTLTGTNVADYLASALVTALLIHVHVSDRYAELVATSILTPLVLVFGGVIPKDLFQRRADVLMYRIATPLWWARRGVAAAGLLWLFRGAAHRLLVLLAPEHVESEHQLLPRVRMQRLLIEGAARGGLTDFQRDTIERVMRMSQVRVADIMVRRERAVMIPRDISREDLLRIAKMAHFSRLPVHRGRSRRVESVLNVYDVMMDERAQPLEHYMRDAVYVRMSEKVPAALLRLQRARETMAIVVDARDECVGLFTMKDLVECIVGELEAW